MAAKPVTEEEALKDYRSVVDEVRSQADAYQGTGEEGPLLGPRLFLLAALGRIPEGRLVQLGTAIELLRRATLVHRAPRAAGGGFTGTLRGDTLLSEAFRLLAADGDPRTVGVLSRTMATVSEGELERHEGEGGWVRRAAFYSGAAATGAVVAGLPEAEAQPLRQWAGALGEAHERILDQNVEFLPPLQPPSLTDPLRPIIEDIIRTARMAS
jgi:hypothetical protein